MSEVAPTLTNAVSDRLFKQTVVFIENGKTSPIPEWCAFCFEVGKSFFDTPRSGLNRTTVLSVPIRDYAAAFCAAGAVIGSTLSLVNRGIGISYDELSRLPQGTIIEYNYGGKWVPAELAGLSETGKLRARFQSNDWFLIGQANISAVRLSTKKQIKLLDKNILNKPDIEKGIFHYLLQTLTGERSLSFPEPGETCCIVSNLKMLRTETTNSRIGVLARNKLLAESNLQEILQIDRFVFSNKIQPRIRAVTPRAGINQTPTQLMIYDGARSFLTNTSQNQGNILVILDRTEPTFEEAARTVHDSYIQRVDIGIEGQLPAAPFGIGVCSYWSEKRS